MPRTIVIQDAVVTQIHILPIEVGFQVRIVYDLRDEAQQVVMSKTGIMYTAKATVSGVPLTPNLTDAMEMALGGLLTAFRGSITTLEGL